MIYYTNKKEVEDRKNKSEIIIKKKEKNRDIVICVVKKD